MIESIDNNDITISGDLNVSLQVGDTVYYEPLNTITTQNYLSSDPVWNVGGDGNATGVVGTSDFTATNSGGGGAAIGNYAYIGQDITLVSGVTYKLSFDVIAVNFSGNYIPVADRSDLQFYNPTPLNDGISSSGVANPNTTITNTFVSNGSGNINIRFGLFNNGDSITIDNVVLEDISNPGVNLIQDGQFDGIITTTTLTNPTAIDSSQIQNVGVVTGINGNIITVDNSGTLPLQGDYCMFIKNQVINMNGLSGYYADVMFENNSKKNVELFAISSEITESSK